MEVNGTAMSETVEQGSSEGRVFYLGPEGTFTHDAAKLFFEMSQGKVFLPCDTPPNVMQKMKASPSAYGVVPFENSIHGEVIQTLDALLFEFNEIYIVGEVSLPITFSLFGLTDRCKPEIVVSHPHALAQCKGFIREHKFIEQSCNSTADACRIVAERGSPDYAAIASATAGFMFKLAPIRTRIEDFHGAHTRFLVLSPTLELSTGATKSMVAFISPSSSSGVLAQLTSAFARRAINIYAIHSRPTKSAVGQYVFTLTVDGSVSSGATREALLELLGFNFRIKILGTYSSAPGIYPVTPHANLDGFLDQQKFHKLIESLKGGSESE